MNKTFRRILSLIMIIAILFSINIPVQAAAGGGEDKDILDPLYDGSGHGALQWKVKGVTTTSSLQAFVIGWNFTFNGNNGQSMTIYIPRKMDYWGAYPPANVYPLSPGWSSSTKMHGIDDTGANAGKTCIRDFINYDPNKTKFDNITSKGCTITANAKIQKYTYDPDRNPKFVATSSSSGNVATSYEELKNDFKEFSDKYITNAESYFDITFQIEPEKVPPPTPTVTLIDPPDGLTIYKGQTFTITGVAKYCKTVDVLINGEVYKTFNCVLDASTGYYKQYSVNTTYTPEAVGDYKIKLQGHTTESISSEDHTVHVIPKPSGEIDVPIPPIEPRVTLVDPVDGLTINIGETFTITGDSVYCESVDVLVNGVVYQSFKCEFDSNAGHYKPYHIKTTYTAPATGTYAVQLKGNGE